MAGGENDAASLAGALRIVVADIPEIVGIGGSDDFDIRALSDVVGGASAITTVVGAVRATVSWFPISDDVLVDVESAALYHCAAESTPQR